MATLALCGSCHLDAAVLAGGDPPSRDGTTVPVGVTATDVAISTTTTTTAADGGDDIGVPVTVHIVRRSDGTGGLPETTVTTALADANAAFASAGIVFCRNGPTRFIDDDFFHDQIDTTAAIDALRDTDPVPGSINVWFTESFADETGDLCTVSAFTFSPVQGIVIARACTPAEGDRSSFVHALGHTLDLFDTSESAFGLECVNGVNCATAGDLVCDTAAAPPSLGTCGPSGTSFGPCAGDGLYAPDLDNFMASVQPACRVTFTPGQLDRARGVLLNLRPELVDACPGPAERYYVDAGVAPGGDGLSWPTAFADLQDALDAAAVFPTQLVEIWIAAGTYRPDRGTGDTTMSFTLRSGLTLRGGFAGDEDDAADADPDGNVTVLSGDLLDNDVPDAPLDDPTYADNALHVVRAPGTDETTRLDGVTIRSGVALTLVEPDFRGGGILLESGVLEITRCRISDNVARHGGGIGGPATGGLFATDCSFTDNRASDTGGVFTIWSDDPLSTYRRCRFLRNSSEKIGGAIAGGGDFHECLFVGNTSGTAGAVHVRQTVRMYGCTVAQNVEAIRGSNGTLELYDSILWGNVGGGLVVQQQVTSPDVVNYCCVAGRGPLPGVHNIREDPQFVDALGPDGEPGTGDEDLRLQAGSPCLDAGDPDTIAPPDATDLDGVPRVEHCRVDIGVYESPFFRADCNANGIGDECDLDAGAADCNGNRIPDTCDLASGLDTDCDGNGVPDACDIATGVLADCDHDGVPDVCAIADGLVEDCNENGVPDDCDLHPHMYWSTGVIAPLHQDSEVTLAITDPPAVLGDAVVTAEAFGDLDGDAQSIRLFLDDVHLGWLFSFDGEECPLTPDVDSWPVARSTLEAAAADGVVLVRFEPKSTTLEFCGDEPTWYRGTVAWPTPATSLDLNGDEIPDECQCIADCAVPTDGAAGVDDLVAVISAWGGLGGPCDLNEDGVVTVDDLLIVILYWGPCP